MNLGNYISVGLNSKFPIQEKNEELQYTKSLLNFAKDAAFCLDSQAQFLYVNDAICRMTEYSREELLSMTMQEVAVDFSLQVWSEQWRSLKQHGFLTFKSQYRTKKKELIPVEITLNYIEQQGREFSCAFARENSNEIVEISVQQWTNKLRDANEHLQQEVSELKSKEAELEISLSILNATLESTAYGIIAVSFEGDILSFNQKFVDMWQIPESLILSRKCPRCRAFFENQLKDPDAFRRVIWEVSSQSDFESYDILELNDGRVFAHYSNPQRIEEKIVGRVWSIWDITESKRTEEALRLNETRFRTLAETTDASIFLIQGMRLCYVNPAGEILTGYTKKELLGNFDLRQLIKSKKRRQVNQQDGSTLSEYQEMHILTKNGTERWLACTVSVIDEAFDFAGNLVELITAIDITDYKKGEAEVRQALEQAKQLSELRARFVSMVCHQFRTPLNVVSFSNSLLKRHIDQWTGEKKRPLLEHIQTAVEQLSHLVDEILFLGKAEAAKLKLDPKPVDLVLFCEDLVAQMQMSNSPNAINFVNRGICSIACIDKKLLHSILTNLLDNAIKYSPSGSAVELILSCQEGKVIFQIKDAGIGIPIKEQQQLFEPFHRGSNVDSIPGTGLGLSIVKTLVDLHGGQIFVESEVGVGTTFTVLLPLVSQRSDK